MLKSLICGAVRCPCRWTGNQLSAIGDVLNIAKEDLYPYWETRLQQHLIAGGIDPLANAPLIQSMFKGIKSFLKV